jgi:signal transduction histidine kinase
LAATIQKYVDADSELRRHLQTQSQTYDDLRHQLKTPVFQAHAIARTALVGKSTEEKLRTSLLALRGLLWKAERVTRAVGLFADLASGRSVEPKLSKLEYPRFVRGLEWAAADIEKMLGEARRIKFNVDRLSFQVLHGHEVRVDYDLLEHALSNVLDNAGKYTYSDTTVRIYGGLTGAGRFHNSVVNKGLRLQKKEVPLCAQRGWRSEDAKAVTGEGSGIGLWIADYIMRAHEGELLIIPVTTEGNTEVKLLFPVARTRSY